MASNMVVDGRKAFSYGWKPRQTVVDEEEFVRHIGTALKDFCP